MADKKLLTKELIAELSAEVDKELGAGRVFSTYEDAQNFAKLNFGVIVRNPKVNDEWIVKLPIKKNEGVSTARKAPKKRKQPLSKFPKTPPGRETNPPPTRKQDLSFTPKPPNPVVIYGEAHPLSNSPCNICGELIPQERINLQPNVTRCVSCQAQYEKVVDTSRKVDEGFGGSRDEVRKMKAKQWGDMVNRAGIGQTSKFKK